MKTYDRRVRRLLVPIVFVVAVPTLAACSSSPDNKAAGGSSSTTVVHTSAVDMPMKVHFGSGSIGAPDPTTTVPNERGNPIPAILSPGQNIVIRNAGCQPQTLEASVTAPVVWTNLTNKPQRVVFKNFPVDSGTIPAGGTFSWSTNDAVAMAYTVEPSGKICKLLMNAAQS